MIKRKDGRWQEQVKLPGMKKYKYFYGTKGQSDAQQQRDIKRQIAEWTRTQERGPLLADLADDWYNFRASDACLSKVTAKTVEGYHAPIKRIKTAFEGRYAKDISPSEIQAFINALAKRGYKRTTVQRPLDVLRMIYDYAITTDTGIRENPCVAVKLPSGLVQERRELADPADIEKVKNGLHLPFGLFAYLLMYTGLREGEACALRYEDFDFERGLINVSKSVSWQPNKPVIKTTKNGKSRTVVLLDPLRDALPAKWTGYLFSDDGGKTPLSKTAWKHKWQAYCKAAGLADPHVVEQTKEVKTALKNQAGRTIKKTYRKTVWTYHIVPHQLRHEFATLCYDAEIPALDAKEMLGHAKIETTQAIYTHIRDSRREKIGSKLNDFVKSMSQSAQVLAK